MVSRTHSVGVILYKNNTVLLVRHTELAKLPTGSYGFPAGRVEEGERPVDAAVRELKEETGLITKAEYLTALAPKESTLVMKKGKKDFLFEPFVCRNYEGTLRPSDKTVPEFVPLDSLAQLKDKFVSDDVIELSRKHYVL